MELNLDSGDLVLRASLNHKSTQSRQPSFYAPGASSRAGSGPVLPGGISTHGHLPAQLGTTTPHPPTQSGQFRIQGPGAGNAGNRRQGQEQASKVSL